MSKEDMMSVNTEWAMNEAKVTLKILGRIDRQLDILRLSAADSSLSLTDIQLAETRIEVVKTLLQGNVQEMKPAIDFLLDANDRLWQPYQPNV